MINKILVPLDGSEISENAISKAIKVLQGNPQGSIIAIRVMEVPADSPILPPSSLNEAREQEGKIIEEYLSGIQSKYSQSPVRLETQMTDIEDGVAETIMKQAEKLDVDVIALTTHGRTGIQRLFFGSVAEKVLRLAPCSVLIVR